MIFLEINASIHFFRNSDIKALADLLFNFDF